MADYIVMRILDFFEEEGIEGSHKYYKKFLFRKPYIQFRAEVDRQLRALGKDNLIVESLDQK